MLVHQQRLHGVADAGPLALGVLADCKGLFEVGALVDIGVAVALVMLQDGHPRHVGHRANQALAAAGNNDIHVVFHLDQFLHRLAIGGADHLDGMLGHALGRAARL